MNLLWPEALGVTGTALWTTFPQELRTRSPDQLRSGQPVLDRLQFARRIPMMTNPAFAIKLEVSQLVEQQIETLRRESALTSAELLDYRMRAEKIKILYQELDRIGRRRVELPWRRAS